MIELGASAARAIFGLLVPPRCLACDEALDPERARRICKTCLESIERLCFEGIPCCPHCGIPTGPAWKGGGDTPCGPCTHSPPTFEAARAWGFHEDALREAVLRLKFSGRSALAAPLGALIAHAAQALPPADAVVAVPLHPRRLRERGFNQAALLARAAAADLDLPMLSGALERVRETGAQTELDRALRAANLRGSMRAERRLVDGRAILLVDDVLTTGATASACAAALLAAGAASVFVATVARAARREAASATM